MALRRNLKFWDQYHVTIEEYEKINACILYCRGHMNGDLISISWKTESTVSNFRIKIHAFKIVDALFMPYRCTHNGLYSATEHNRKC